MKRFSIGRVLAGTAGFLLAAGTYGQSFNVDYDLYNGHPDGGAGAPSSSFGAASGQVGFWDSFPHNFDGPYYLKDLRGVQTRVAVYASGRGPGAGWNNFGLSGDFKKLMADGQFISIGFELRLEGLASGMYRVFTYCLLPNGTSGESIITISAASAPIQRAAGVLTSNGFQEGLTHTVHSEVGVSEGILRIQGDGPWPRAFLNGFQVIMVPEPTGLFSFSAVFAGYLIFRRKLVK